MIFADGRLCAHLALHLEVATGSVSVDHFVPRSRDWEGVHDWKSDRLACALVNSKKRVLLLPLDPFTIGPGLPKPKGLRAFVIG